jgi:transcriptional regulator with XRE-family HTH domain
MNRIEPAILAKLLRDKGLSLADLAKAAKLDKGTIWRLAKGKVAKARELTVKTIARALDVDPAVLSGEVPAPETINEAPVSKRQLNVRVSTAASNGLELAARRYGLKQSQIVELSPFLFCWAAETCLKQRHERLNEFNQLAKEKDSKIPHLASASGHDDEKSDWELQSIDRRDLFSTWLHTRFDTPFRFDPDTENPFAMFLRDLADATDGVAKFKGWSGEGGPDYRVCAEEAAELVGGDADRANEILHGEVSLSEMPKEVRPAEKAKDRAQWVRETAAEHRKTTAEYWRTEYWKTELAKL